MSTQHALALPSPEPSNTLVINARCSLRIEADQRVIVIAGLPVHHYRAEDTVAEAYAMVFLVDSGFAQQTDVARAFGRSVRTIRRFQKRYEQGGMAALSREAGWRRGRRRISGKRLRTIEALKSKGMSNRAIAHQLGVGENAIRKLVGPSKPAERAQLALPAIPSAAEGPAATDTPSATPSGGDGDLATESTANKGGDRDPITAPEAANDDEPVPMSLDREAEDRTLDRQLAYLGLLDDAIEVAYRMFERWRQENFFKYMREEFLLDALVDYQIEPEDPTRIIANPERRLLDKEISAARADLARLEREYGTAAANNAEQRRRTMRGFKIAHNKLGKQLRKARARVSQLLNQRRGVSKHIEVRELNERVVVKLATERKHLTDIIKMVAYQAESDLVALLRPHYARVDQEGRTLLHELFATPGDMRVADNELHITLAPLSSPHRTHAAQVLCEILDKTATTFPGSRLHIRFTMRPPRRIGLAFPGSPVERSTPAIAADS